MIRGITAFEIRYQLRNPVFWVAIAIFFLMGFGVTASENIRIGTPGAVHENAPYAIAVAISSFALFYLFVITAFVANAIVRDDNSGFAPIVRSTSVTANQIVIGRFLGGFLIALIGYLAVPIGMAFGCMMPWVDPETVGPQNISYYAWNFLVFGVPNIFLMSAVLFAVATVLRSMMAAYIAAITLVMAYLISGIIVSQNLEYRDTFARWEPMGSNAVVEASRYWTQSEMNSRLVELSGLVLFNRAYVIILGFGFLGLALWRFSMTERAPSRWRLKRLASRKQREAKVASTPAQLGGDAVVARECTPSVLTQFLTRLRVEVRQVLNSPGLIILTLLAITFSGVVLFLAQSSYGTPDHPTVSATITGVMGGSALFLLLIAAFYGGELVWRERDRKMNELIDSTAVPSWVMTVPKMLAIFLILLIVNVASALTGIVYALVQGAREIGLLDYFLWFIIPAAIDGLLIAILAVFVQVLSPNKYVGWGILFIWFVGGIFLRNMGYGDPLYNYGRGPSVPLSDFVGAGSFWKGAEVFQFYWLCFAVILAVLAHMMWPRGTDLSVRSRLKRVPHMASGLTLGIIAIAAIAMAGTGAYAYWNIKVLNRYQTSDQAEKWAADYERKYLKYEKLPQPAITHVELDAQLYPEKRLLITEGRYDLVNKTNAPLTQIHIRKGAQQLEWLKLDVAGAHLVSDDKDFGYRIYQFDKPLAPGAKTTLTFKSQLWRRGFRASQPATDLLENGTFVNNSSFAPIIGMDRSILLDDRTQRRRQHLPAELRVPKLEDMSATNKNYIGSDWVTSRIRLTTDAAQIPIAPGARVSDTTSNGRRTATFVSTAPILNFFSIQSARYDVASVDHNGIKLSVFYHPGHDWNVRKMLRAMAVSLDYYRSHFGPYQFNYARIIEFPGYNSFAQAFAGTMPYSESAGFNANTNDPDKIDFTTYVVAHEMSHQYWAHQVIGAEMQGMTATSETLAQYSALMVMKRIYGPDQIRRFLKYELDNYLRSRQAEAIEEVPLERVENQQYIHYRKGAVAMYLLQQRLGEDAVDRALSRFLAKWRFKGPPYLRSVDMVQEFRKEAKTPEQQQLITDLFEKITLYDLKVADAKTKKDATGWTTTITVKADKFYASGKGVETRTRLAEPIEIGLFTARPGLGAFSSKDVIVMEQKPIVNGTQEIVVHSARKPTFAGIDPYNYYIDRNSDDNVKEVTS